MSKYPLQWSETFPPNESVCYHHVIAETPFGRILITWKGWKERDNPTVDEHPVPGFFAVGDDVEDAKDLAECAYSEAVDRCICG